MNKKQLLYLSGVISAIVYKKYGQQLAQIINKYHKNKTPEIQEIIDQTIEGKYE